MLPSAASGSAWRRGIVSLSICSNLIAAFLSAIADARTGPLLLGSALPSAEVDQPSACKYSSSGRENSGLA
jgi:hypothetical protein